MSVALPAVVGLIVTVRSPPDRLHAAPPPLGVILTVIGNETSSTVPPNQPVIWAKSASAAAMTAFVRAGSGPEGFAVVARRLSS